MPSANAPEVIRIRSCRCHRWTNCRRTSPRRWRFGDSGRAAISSHDAGGRRDLERDFTFYAGPKKYTILAEIAGPTKQSSGTWDGRVLGDCFKGALIGMNWLHDTLSFPFCLTIIAITFIIKMVFCR